MASEDQHDGGSSEIAVAAAERVTFFSDAVVAIAITLLAIELPVPDGETTAALWESLVENSFDYLAFLISFLVIANHWIVHHRIFRWVRRMDAPAIQLNFLWLLLVVVNPFLTRVITEGDLDFLRFSMYAIAQTLQWSTFAVMIAVLTRNEWFAQGTPASVTHHGWLRSLVPAVAFLVSVPVYLLVDRWAFAVWALVPMVGGRLLRRAGAIVED